MPLVFRAMQSDGKAPIVGHSRNDTLGVRETTLGPNGKEIQGDVKQVSGIVHPGMGGMSVSPAVEELPPHLIPKRFLAKYPAARRGNSLPDTFPWQLGDGTFAAGSLAEKLQLRIDPDDAGHGFVEPDAPMSLQELRTAVEATCPKWSCSNW